MLLVSWSLISPIRAGYIYYVFLYCIDIDCIYVTIINNYYYYYYYKILQLEHGVTICDRAGDSHP